MEGGHVISPTITVRLIRSLYLVLAEWTGIWDEDIAGGRRSDREES